MASLTDELVEKIRKWAEKNSHVPSGFPYPPYGPLPYWAKDGTSELASVLEELANEFDQMHPWTADHGEAQYLNFRRKKEEG